VIQLRRAAGPALRRLRRRAPHLPAVRFAAGAASARARGELGELTRAPPGCRVLPGPYGRGSVPARLPCRQREVHSVNLVNWSSEGPGLRAPGQRRPTPAAAPGMRRCPVAATDPRCLLGCLHTLQRLLGSRRGAQLGCAGCAGGCRVRAGNRAGSRALQVVVGAGVSARLRPLQAARLVPAPAPALPRALRTTRVPRWGGPAQTWRARAETYTPCNLERKRRMTYEGNDTQRAACPGTWQRLRRTGNEAGRCRANRGAG
jgi:hypothetical protein